MSQFSDAKSLSPIFTPNEPGIYVLDLNYDGCPANGLTYVVRDTDYNGDGSYTASDLMPVLIYWTNVNDPHLYDINLNGRVDVMDYLSMCSGNK